MRKTISDWDHSAICNSVIDLWTQETPYWNKRKIFLWFTVLEDNNPLFISKEITRSNNEWSFLSAIWKILNIEFDVIKDLEKIIWKTIWITVETSKKWYSDIRWFYETNDVVEYVQNRTTFFSFDDGNMEVLDTLSKWLVDVIKNSIEYKKCKSLLFTISEKDKERLIDNKELYPYIDEWKQINSVLSFEDLTIELYNDFIDYIKYICDILWIKCCLWEYN